MDGLPKDPAARLEALERWADEQLRQPERVRSRTKVAHALFHGDRRRRALLSADRGIEWVSERLLDRGSLTWGEVHLPEHGRADRVGYVPSRWHVLPRSLRYIEVTGNDTFVDFGCGKGRVVHQAARHPFRRVIGVELSPELAGIARTLLAARSHQHRCRDVEIVVSDAREFQVPDDFTVGYFFRPFGEETLATVMQGIVESLDRNPRLIRLIYLWEVAPVASTILATSRFRLVKRLPTSLIRAAVPPVGLYESA